jgi:hypothetical protein
LIEIDRARLEEATCECYRIMRRETDRIVPDEAVMPSCNPEKRRNESIPIALESRSR